MGNYLELPGAYRGQTGRCCSHMEPNIAVQYPDDFWCILYDCDWLCTAYILNLKDLEIFGMGMVSGVYALIIGCGGPCIPHPTKSPRRATKNDVTGRANIQWHIDYRFDKFQSLYWVAFFLRWLARCCFFVIFRRLCYIRVAAADMSSNMFGITKMARNLLQWLLGVHGLAERCDMSGWFRLEWREKVEF